MVKPALGPSQALGGSAFLNLPPQAQTHFSTFSICLGLCAPSALSALLSFRAVSGDSVGPLGLRGLASLGLFVEPILSSPASL